MLVDFFANLVNFAPSSDQLRILTYTSECLFSIVFEKCAVDEESSIYYGIEYVRKILSFTPNLSFSLVGLRSSH